MAILWREIGAASGGDRGRFGPALRRASAIGVGCHPPRGPGWAGQGPPRRQTRKIRHVGRELKRRPRRPSNAPRGWSPQFRENPERPERGPTRMGEPRTVGAAAPAAASSACAEPLPPSHDRPIAWAEGAIAIRMAIVSVHHRATPRPRTPGNRQPPSPVDPRQPLAPGAASRRGRREPAASVDRGPSHTSNHHGSPRRLPKGRGRTAIHLEREVKE